MKYDRKSCEPERTIGPPAPLPTSVPEIAEETGLGFMSELPAGVKNKLETGTAGM